jgi:hypothetical protein
LIFQTGHGTPLRPTVYKFPELSPVNPSIANGVVMRVVKVADQAIDHPKQIKRAISSAFKPFAFIFLLLVFWSS